MRGPLESKYLAGHHYGLNDFDKHMCLQPGLVIWLVIAFLMRPYIVMVMSFAQMGNRMGTIDLVYPDRIWFAVDALAALPAVLVVVVSWMRRPGARAGASGMAQRPYLVTNQFGCQRIGGVDESGAERVVSYDDRVADSAGVIRVVSVVLMGIEARARCIRRLP